MLVVDAAGRGHDMCLSVVVVVAVVAGGDGADPECELERWRGLHRCLVGDKRMREDVVDGREVPDAVDFVAAVEEVLLVEVDFECVGLKARCGGGVGLDGGTSTVMVGVVLFVELQLLFGVAVGLEDAWRDQCTMILASVTLAEG